MTWAKVTKSWSDMGNGRKIHGFSLRVFFNLLIGGTPCITGAHLVWVFKNVVKNRTNPHVKNGKGLPSLTFTS